MAKGKKPPARRTTTGRELVLVERSGRTRVLKPGHPIQVKSTRDACRALIRVTQFHTRALLDEEGRRDPILRAAHHVTCDMLTELAMTLGGPRCAEEVTFACNLPSRAKRQLAREAGPARRARRMDAPPPVREFFGLHGAKRRWPGRSVRFRSPCTPLIVQAKQLRTDPRACYEVVAEARDIVSPECAAKVEFACHKPRRGPGRKRLYAVRPR